MMVYNTKTGDAYINYNVIWSFFEEGISLKYDEMKDIMSKWLTYFCMRKQL